MNYRASFTGRQVGAIGVFYEIITVCRGDDEKAATLDLYTRYEHITHLKLTPIIERSTHALPQS